VVNIVYFIFVRSLNILVCTHYLN